MRKGAQEIKDLDVDRVDGVDKPATGRNFLLFKSEDGDAVVKGYAITATAAHNVLKALRKDERATLSRSTATALNGLAQVLGEDAVFVGKSVPTQPYEITEDPDVDKRGPADEDLGPNFVARSMTALKLKDVSEQVETVKAGPQILEDKAKAEPVAAKVKGDLPPWLEGKGDKKKEPDEDDMGVAKAIGAMAEAIKSNTEVLKVLAGAGTSLTKIEKAEAEKAERVEKPRSRQVDEDEPVRVRKSSGYEPRFATDMSNVVFGRNGQQ